MKVLIVAKTRKGTGACVGGITSEGRSVRLVTGNATHTERAGLEYEVGEVWEIDSIPDPGIVPPHVENIVVRKSDRLRISSKLRETIFRFMPPVVGGPEKLFDGVLRSTASGGLYVSHENRLPTHSTTFWIPDRALRLDSEGKRIRYRYPTADGGVTVTFVGFQEPLEKIPAGTLLRVSLAHWWRPADRQEEESRCFVQLSGWLLDEGMPPQQPKRNHAESAEDERGSALRTIRQTELPQRADEALKRIFGFSEFLPLQREVVLRVLQGQDALVIMPTGGGKSICYQLPAVVFDGLTVVVSPLVALMQDQINHLQQSGVRAACLNHLVAIADYTATMNDVRHGLVKLLYLAPETLLRPEILLLLEQSELACLAIDEAHCISEWGHDFRPEYRQLAGVRQRFPKAACLALTATATPRVREDIRSLLRIPDEGEFVASFDRPNLFLAVEPRRDGLAQVLDFLQRRREQSGIIYCGRRRKADELCKELNDHGWPALTYHAGLSGEDRRRNQDRFIHDEVRLMVATIAFGMGINKPNIRFVIHAHLPGDLESYYQEIGRAGRDGLPADCLLLYSRGDAVLHRRFIEDGAASQREGREARLNAMLAYAEARKCRRHKLLTYFDERPATTCGGCDNCVRSPAQGALADVTTTARKCFECIKATGQTFGAAHIIGVLRGSRARRILSRNHDRLRVFGTGKELTTEQWDGLLEHLVRLGFLERNLEFGNLHLTSRSWDVIHGKVAVSVPASGNMALPSPSLSSPLDAPTSMLDRSRNALNGHDRKRIN